MGKTSKVEQNQQPHKGNRLPLRPNHPDRGRFLCGGKHYMKDCPKRDRLSAIIAEDSESQRVSINPLVLNAICATSALSDQLMYVQVTLNHQKLKAMVDTGASHLFVADRVATRLRLKISAAQDRLKTVNAIEQSVVGISFDIPIELGAWKGRHHVRVVKLDDFDVGSGFL